MLGVYKLLIIASVVLLMGTQTEHPPELTKADIPANMPSELKKLVEQTFSADAYERSLATKKIGEMKENAVPAIPFLIHLFNDDSLSVQDNAEDALAVIGE